MRERDCPLTEVVSKGESKATQKDRIVTCTLRRYSRIQPCIDRSMFSDRIASLSRPQVSTKLSVSSRLTSERGRQKSTESPERGEALGGVCPRLDFAAAQLCANLQREVVKV